MKRIAGVSMLIIMVVTASADGVSAQTGEAHADLQLSVKLTAVQLPSGQYLTGTVLNGQLVKVTVLVSNMTLARELVIHREAARLSRRTAARQGLAATMEEFQPSLRAKAASLPAWEDYVDIECLRLSGSGSGELAYQAVVLDTQAFVEKILVRPSGGTVAERDQACSAVLDRGFTSSLPPGEYIVRAFLDTRGTSEVGTIRASYSSNELHFVVRPPVGDDEAWAVSLANAGFLAASQDYVEALSCAMSAAFIHPGYRGHAAELIVADSLVSLGRSEEAIIYYEAALLAWEGRRESVVYKNVSRRLESAQRLVEK